MQSVGCGSAAVTERPERTAQGYRRFRCCDCGRQFNERSGGLLNRTTDAPFTYEDACVRLGPHVGHDPEAAREATAAVTKFLQSVLKP